MRQGCIYEILNLVSQYENERKVKYRIEAQECKGSTFIRAYPKSRVTLLTFGNTHSKFMVQMRI